MFQKVDEEVDGVDYNDDGDQEDQLWIVVSSEQGGGHDGWED